MLYGERGVSFLCSGWRWFSSRWRCRWFKWWRLFFFSSSVLILIYPDSAVATMIQPTFPSLLQSAGASQCTWCNGGQGGFHRGSVSEYVRGAEGGAKADGGMKAEVLSSVSAAVLDASLVLQVVVTVLTNPHGWRDLQPFDLRLEAATPEKEGGVTGTLKNGKLEVCEWVMNKIKLCTDKWEDAENVWIY